MTEPTLDALQVGGEMSDDSAADDYSLGQKVAVAFGIACMGGYIGYNLFYNSSENVPQALWSRKDETEAPTSTLVRPRIALVNMPDKLRSCALAGLRAWLDVASEVEPVFPTVTFIEEEEAATIADLVAEVRRASVFAWGEVRECSEAHVSTCLEPLCSVVYRTLTEVNGQVLDDWNVRGLKAERWHGKRFVSRHCVGFSVDGKHGTVLVHDVEGVIDAERASDLSGDCVRDCDALVREYGVPTTATFHRWRLSAAVRPCSTTSQSPAESLPGLGARLRDGKHCRLWQSPLHVFAALGAVLRYNRTDAAAYPDYITTPLPTMHSAGVVSTSLSSCMTQLARRCAPLLLRQYAARQSERRERELSLSSSFAIVMQLADASAAVTPDILRIGEKHLAEWIRDMTGVPSGKKSLPTTHRIYEQVIAMQAETLKPVQTVHVDLTEMFCSVLAAEWLLIRVVSLFSALGLVPALAQLIAVPGPQVSTSLLFPTPNKPHLRHLWFPGPMRASLWTATERDVESPCLTTNHAMQEDQFLGAAASAPAEHAFVVSEHDFSDF